MSKVLVVANETVGAEELLRELRRIEDERTSEFLVVVPAMPVQTSHRAVWTQDGAQDAARRRLDATLAILREEGLEASGEVGDMRPFDAVRDALDRFPADLIVISTHPLGRSGWLRKNVVERIRDRFGVPVVHIVSHVHEAAGT